ncbi:acetate--CoA ligase family protein [Oleidesulfovibrio sp.]|uniref:acetate--CoA ligase family protein n=1 Tax=Oleidesulfovibrio sp. TaxID=2909707 RepID=UPI003A86FE8B
MRLSQQIAALFSPQAVAVIGASATKGKIGNVILANLLQAGYAGKIYPVNPHEKSILGLRCINRITNLSEKLDLAVVSIPPDAVLNTIDQLGSIGTKACIVITAGFKEIGGKGWHLEADVKKMAERHNIALLGPNCLGLINTSHFLNTTFATGQPRKGSIGFFSQSGALCVAILDWAQSKNIGFSNFISLGNKALLDEAHMLDYLADDPDTSVVLGYIEGVECGARFIKSARDATKRKPVIMLKSGTTAAGAKAASSHTGAITGADQAYDAAFNKTGIIRVRELEELFSLAQAFSMQPLPEGPALAVVTNAGGPGILAADACEQSHLSMASLSGDTVEGLKQILPPFASFYNPVDLIGDAKADRFCGAIDLVLRDPHVDTLLLLAAPTARTGIEEIAQAIVQTVATYKKPVFCSLMGGKGIEQGKLILEAGGIPCYEFPEQAIKCIDAMYMYRSQNLGGTRTDLCTMRNFTAARQVIDHAMKSDSQEIVEFQVHQILTAYGLSFPKTFLCRTSTEAVQAAEKIGYPVVLKIASPDISHKSDIGGVVVNLKTPTEVAKAFSTITTQASKLRKDAYITGCIVQKMAPSGAKEVIVGVRRDPQFGPMLMFGLGGIYVEVLRDVSFRLAPLSREDARDMIREIKSFPLLRGIRGEAAIDFASLERIILAMSQLALDFPEILEAEFNPVLVYDSGALVADARAILSVPAPTCTMESEPEQTRRI